MDNKQNNIYGLIKTAIQNDPSLDDQEKLAYFDCLFKLESNQLLDGRILKDLNNYLNNEIKAMEEAAITARDADLINSLADLRIARTELEKAIFMLYETDDSNLPNNPQI